jgi:DNA topoisomerase-1
MLVDKIQERGYVKKEDIKGKQIQCKDLELEDDTITETNTTREFGNEKGKLVIQSLGIIVMEFLDKNFKELFNYDYTKEMEDNLDKISKGEKVWYTLCASCMEQLDALINKVKDENKHEIKIDEFHYYTIAKYGPVVKCVTKGDKGENVISFKEVKKDIDIKKLERGEYKLEDILENKSNKTTILGKFEGHDLVLKRGKFGLYVSWGENSKSLSFMGNRPTENITYEEVLELLKEAQLKEEIKKTNIIRVINDNISIRNGQYGDYIFYKTSRMKSPKFFKIDKFKNDYKNCDLALLKRWIHEEYNVITS